MSKTSQVILFREKRSKQLKFFLNFYKNKVFNLKMKQSAVWMVCSVSLLWTFPVFILFQEISDGQLSSDPKTESSSSGDPPPSTGDGSKPSGAQSLFGTSVPPKPEGQLDPAKPSESSPNAGVKASVSSPMESLMGSTRVRDGGPRTTTLSAAELIRGPRVYRPANVVPKKPFWVKKNAKA